ncbi:L-aspartate oxidase [Scytonema sp. NUACC26]|uniref:L-aspartate oxidase n=1 Tax=Scytonema sp. NUACC26 TaxID=3140176 RepID=UPI0034DC5383
MTTNSKSEFDIIVVGAGAAGLYTALCIPADLKIGLITKETLSLSASDWAQGGIAAAISPQDSPSFHVEDTMWAGVGLCDREAVEFLANKASSCIQSLIELGVAFDRRGNELALTLEAAHSHNRVLHSADTTGREVITTLTNQVLQRPNIQVIQQALALNLWLEPETKRCQGISLFYQGRVTWVKASAVVLATGGGGQVFAQTTNPAVSTGDGVAMAWRVGAILRDLEFVQFHPTALTKPGRFLISEAVRGEGAYLIDREGRRFAFDYHPSGELAPRDVVSRAIFTHLQRTSEDLATASVWLDMRPIPAEKIRHRFPNIIKVCQHWGIDVFSEPVPVAPAAHYWMGGIVTDLANRTNIPGLFAVGETASTGVHGANRLASNSLLECIVFGAQMGQVKNDIKKNELQESDFILHSLSFTPSNSEWVSQQECLEEVRQKLPRLVWENAGICREQSGMEAAIATVESWQREIATLSISKFLKSLQPTQSATLNLPDVERQIRLWAETNNLLDIGYLILKSAAFRTESRGGHYRCDYPHSDPSWQVHTLVQHDKWWKSSVIQ